MYNITEKRCKGMDLIEIYNKIKKLKNSVIKMQNIDIYLKLFDIQLELLEYIKRKK